MGLAPIPHASTARPKFHILACPEAMDLHDSPRQTLNGWRFRMFGHAAISLRRMRQIVTYPRASFIARTCGSSPMTRLPGFGRFVQKCRGQDRLGGLILNNRRQRAMQAFDPAEAYRHLVRD